MPRFSFFVVLAFGLVAAGCDFSELQNFDDEYKLIIELPATEVTMTGQIVDAATGQIIDQPIQLSVAGPNADLVTDPYLLEPIEPGEIEIGAISLGLKQGVTPTPENPVVFNVLVSSEGYLSGSRSISLQTSGEQGFVIPLVRASAPPAGVAVTQTSSGRAGSDGAVTEAVAVDTETVDFNVPAGTVIRDASGQTLQGDLRVTAVSYDAREVEALDAFPGGLQTATLEDGTTGGFLTVGFATVEVRDESDRLAETFSGPFGLAVAIDEGLRNPQTGAALNAGETVPAWRYDTVDGLWRAAGEATVNESGQTLSLDVQAAHLSSYNFGWFSGEANACELPVRLTSKPEGVPVTVVLTGSSSFYLAVDQTEGSEVRFPRVPEAVGAVDINVYYGREPFGSASNVDVCGGGVSVGVDGLEAFISQFVTADISVSVRCDGVQAEGRLNGTFLYAKTGTQNWLSASAVAGRVRIPGLEAGASYTVMLPPTYYNGRYYSGSTEVVVPADEDGDGVVVVSEAFSNVESICSQL